MTSLTINLPEKLESELKHWEAIINKSKDFIIKEALIQYLEDLEDIKIVENHIKNKDRAKYYTSEELKRKLNLE